MEEMLMRLRLLKDSGTISKDVFENVKKLLHRFSDKNMINNSDTVIMMMVHITMALQRAYVNESVIEMEDSVKEEINSSENIDKALKLWDENKDILGVLSDNEKYFILANFCNHL